MAIPKSINALRSGISDGNIDSSVRRLLNTRSEPVHGYRPEPINRAVDQYIKGINGVNAPLQWPTDLPPFYMTIGIYDYDRSSPFNSSNAYLGKPIHTIKLPLAMGLADAQMVHWDVDHIAKDFWSNIVGSNLTDMVRSLSSAVSGAVVNSVLVAAFKGPTFKEHKVMWTLIPRNEAESKMVRQIIARLNWAAASVRADGGLWFHYPSVVKLGFSQNITSGLNGIGTDGVATSDQRSKFYRFKPGVIKMIRTNYLPANHPVILHSGYPEAVQLSIQIMEAEYWVKADYEQEAIGNI